VVRNIRALPDFWDADAPPAFHPMIRIEGSGAAIGTICTRTVGGHKVRTTATC